MEQVEGYAKRWGSGDIDDWKMRIVYYVGLTPRTVQEGYLEPLIAVGVLSCDARGKVAYVGEAIEEPLPPKDDGDDDMKELVDKPVKKPKLTAEEKAELREKMLKDGAS